MASDREWVELVLLAAPAGAALLSSEAVLAAQVAFCVSAAGVGLVNVFWSSAPRPPADLRGRLSAVVSALWMPGPAAVVGLAVLAAGRSFSGDVGSGLRTAGLAMLAVAAVLTATRPPAPVGPRSLPGRAGRTRSSARADGLAGLTLVDLAEPVTELAARSDDLARDLRRLSVTGYGVVGGSVDDVRLVRLEDLDRGGAAYPDGRWEQDAVRVPVMDGGEPVRTLDHLPEGEDVWLVSAGDLVIGVVTSRARHRAEAVARVRGWREGQPSARSFWPAAAAGLHVFEQDGMPGQRKGRA